MRLHWQPALRETDWAKFTFLTRNTGCQHSHIGHRTTSSCSAALPNNSPGISTPSSPAFKHSIVKDRDRKVSSSVDDQWFFFPGEKHAIKVICVKKKNCVPEFMVPWAPCQKQPRQIAEGGNWYCLALPLLYGYDKSLKTFAAVFTIEKEIATVKSSTNGTKRWSRKHRCRALYEVISWVNDQPRVSRHFKSML